MPFHPNLMRYREQYFARIGEKPSQPEMFDFVMKELNRRFRFAIVRLKGESDVAWGSHTLRHSLATYLERECRWPVDYVGMFLCHDSGNITHRYTHDRIETLREMIVKLPLE